MTSGICFGLVLFTLGFVMYVRAVYQSRERARQNLAWLRRQEEWYRAVLSEARGPEPARLIDMLGRGERLTISGIGPKGQG